MVVCVCAGCPPTLHIRPTCLRVAGVRVHLPLRPFCRCTAGMTDFHYSSATGTTEVDFSLAEPKRGYHVGLAHPFHEERSSAALGMYADVIELFIPRQVYRNNAKTLLNMDVKNFTNLTSNYHVQHSHSTSACSSPVRWAHCSSSAAPPHYSTVGAHHSHSTSTCTRVGVGLVGFVTPAPTRWLGYETDCQAAPKGQSVSYPPPTRPCRTNPLVLRNRLPHQGAPQVPTPY